MSAEILGEGKLGDIADVNMGQSPEGSTCNVIGIGVPLLNGPTEFGGRHPSPVQFTTDPKKFAQPEDLLFCVRGSTTGRMNWADQQYAIGRGIAALRHKDGKEYQGFLRGIIEFKLDSLLVEATGSTFPNVSRQQIENLEIPIFSPLAQRRIAAILTALDDKIELNRRMNETLEGIAQAVWGEWFGEAETSDPIELGDLVEFNPRLSIAQGDEVVYVEMKDVPEHGLCISGFVQKPFTSGSKFQLNDTLLARITPCLENGKTAFVNFLEEGEKAFGSTEFIVMRAKDGVSPYYVYFIARDERFRQFAISSMVGSSGRQRVQTEILTSFEIANPNSQQMAAFHAFAKPIFEKIFLNFQESQTLTALRDVLLPRLMRGEIPV